MKANEKKSNTGQIIQSSILKTKEKADDKIIDILGNLAETIYDHQGATTFSLIFRNVDTVDFEGTKIPARSQPLRLEVEWPYGPTGMKKIVRLMHVPSILAAKCDLIASECESICQELEQPPLPLRQKDNCD